MSKGIALIELKRYKEALNSFDRAKDIEPNDPLVWSNRGFVLEKLGKPTEARDSDRKADRGK
ncbi:MAG: tetratricopeptide repeat protein [Xenococcaceae cyanobacterium]